MTVSTVGLDAEVCIMGAGIVGSLVAGMLADRGVSVALVDRHDAPMSGASLWNEGKIHLGYTYTGTESTATAELMLAGAAAFAPTLEEFVGSPLPEEWFSKPVIYLVDEASLIDASTLWQRAQGVATLLTESLTRLPGLKRYLTSSPALEVIDLDEASKLTGQCGFRMAWRTTERAISPFRVAGLIRRALAARDVALVRGEIQAVDGDSNRRVVHLDGGASVSARVVINATWEQRATIDSHVAAGERDVSLRYKVSLFGQQVGGMSRVSPSTRIVGRFGDITPYGSGEAYLSWYPAGLLASSDTGAVPSLPVVVDQDIIDATLTGLGIDHDSWSRFGGRWTVAGGFVVARGYGDIDRIDSPLHERPSRGVVEIAPGFVSVDTGKYTLGPMMALRTVRLVEGILRRQLGRHRERLVPWRK